MPYPNMTEAVVPAAHENFSNCDRNLRAAHKKLTGSEFLVYFGLVQIANHQGQLKKSLEELKKECNVRRTTLIKALDSLVSMGMLRRLGDKYKGYSYQITQLEDWVERPDCSGTKSVLQGAKAVATKVYSQVVQKLDVTKTEQPDSTHPPKGGVLESEVFSEKQFKNCTSTNVQLLNTNPEPAFKDEYAKREALSKLGILAGITWEGDRPVVVINHLVMSVEEFMQRSLDSFKQTLQPCLEGLALAKAQIEKIKAKNKRSFSL